MKKIIATSKNEYKEVTQGYVTKEETQLYGVKDYYVQSYNGVFVLNSSDEIVDFIYNGDDLIDLVIPEKITLWLDTDGNVHMNELKTITAVNNNKGTSGWTSKNKVKSLYVENLEIKGSNILRGSTSLESVNVKKIVGIDCFRGCTNLLTATIRDSVSNRSFFDCTKLHTANVYGNVEEYAFYGTTSLKNVNFLGTGITLGVRAFSVTGLEEIHIKGVSTIYSICFGYNPLLKYVIFEDNTITTIHNEAFENCAISGFITLPSSLNYISYQAFAYNDIEELRIPSTVTTIVASNTLQGGILMGNSVEATIKTNAPSKPSGWGDYFALWSQYTYTYHTVEYGASW